ncbi:MAG: CPCC family cysteine-rich protein [Luteolibacter sp.]
MNPERYPCPCCGYRTYALPKGGTMQICPVCFWEDLPSEKFRFGDLPVETAQKCFFEKGACEERYRDAVRAPLSEEARSPAWLAYEDLRTQIIGFIEFHFNNVTRDGGTTLHQMEVLDDYGSAEDLAEAAKLDTESTWEEISDLKLSNFACSMVFLDAKGFRFHLPAFMRFTLANWKDGAAVCENMGVIYALSAGPHGFHHEVFEILSHAQLEATASFLWYIANSNDSLAEDAESGLACGWNKFLPDFVRLFSESFSNSL